CFLRGMLSASPSSLPPSKRSKKRSNHRRSVMPNFTATNGSTAGVGTQQSVAAAYTQTTLAETCSSANGGTTAGRRGKVYDILVGTNAAPGDTFIEWQVSRVTTSSTATFQTPQALDSADAASVVLSVVNSSGTGTVSVQNLWYLGMNQRAS